MKEDNRETLISKNRAWRVPTVNPTLYMGAELIP